MLVQILESLPPTLETWTEFWAFGFGLLQPQLLQTFRVWTSEWELSAYFCCSLFYVQPPQKNKDHKVSDTWDSLETIKITFNYLVPYSYQQKHDTVQNDDL